MRVNRSWSTGRTGSGARTLGSTRGSLNGSGVKTTPFWQAYIRLFFSFFSISFFYFFWFSETRERGSPSLSSLAISGNPGRRLTLSSAAVGHRAPASFSRKGKHRTEACDPLFMDPGFFSLEYKPRSANLGLKFSVQSSLFCFSVCDLFSGFVWV